ncbi:MAG: cob(I)yrinic acid a,c-diamide adenosyltransferase [Calditrichaeota bacterium]|nr:MAG: cob(I)yrinic acid a,c-diamide adenosyltransferase [Calditrichota bacterium]MBL1206953.1 cob(I)yrinic acid a,c-diamide adenosyltransferase [Calditrichota bacterium]NOG46780.1 cob(I)yrinic acid a,c-diamide adenosyltransferase [Calditrichota bacterium]
MKIYTGYGDEGKTALFGGETVKKNHLRVEMYGTLDELNSLLGLLRNKNNDDDVDAILKNIQNELFTYGSEIATPKAAKLDQFTDHISETHISALENAIDKLSEKVPPLKQFILPGGSEAACYAHQSRTVCRRAERMLIKLAEEIEIRGQLIIYLNRLSDLFFVIARYQNVINSVDDTVWDGIRKPKK